MSRRGTKCPRLDSANRCSSSASHSTPQNHRGSKSPLTSPHKPTVGLADANLCSNGSSSSAHRGAAPAPPPNVVVGPGQPGSGGGPFPALNHHPMLHPAMLYPTLHHPPLPYPPPGLVNPFLRTFGPMPFFDPLGQFYASLNKDLMMNAQMLALRQQQALKASSTLAQSGKQAGEHKKASAETSPAQPGVTTKATSRNFTVTGFFAPTSSANSSPKNEKLAESASSPGTNSAASPPQAPQKNARTCKLSVSSLLSWHI